MSATSTRSTTANDTLSGTPADVAIRPRHPQFEPGDALARDWHGNDPFKTAFFNALSLTFPLGEKYFIDSIRLFQPQIEEPRLKQEIRGFIGQEALHSREHREMNATMCALRGYDSEAVEGRIRERTAWIKANLTPIQQLAATVASEHLTAILGNALLTDPHWLEGADPTMARLWRWHALEEVEHKAVTFDVYLAAGGDRALIRRMLWASTLQLAGHVFAGMRMMLKASGQHRNPLVWARGLAWLFGRPGVVRRMRAFRAPDFHPWQEDNRELIHAWLAETGGVAA